MENYIVSARKYRPATFSSVVGQKALTATLKNAIATDRLAHAYLFCGSRGVGKTSCARIFAKTINCEHPTPDGDPCNCCDSCREFNENRSLNIIELDAASNNSVDDIRQLVDQVRVPPAQGRYRVFIVDEVHMLSSAAFNAFLKTLEEPPSYVVFILATTEKQKIIPTILSRCQIYDFSRITVSDMIDHLEYVARQEGITAERSALAVIAKKADGAMRDALSIFDQIAASSRGNITYASAIENLNVLDSSCYSRLMESFISSDVPGALLIYKDIIDRGFDSHFFVTGLASFIRDLMVAKSPQTASLLDADDDVRKQMTDLAARVPVDFFYKAMSLCNDADLNFRMASSKTFLVELLLIKLCQLLSPSPIFSGNGEGQLKPFAANNPPQPHVAPVPAAIPTVTPPHPTQLPPSVPAVKPVSFSPPPAFQGKTGKILRSTRQITNSLRSPETSTATNPPQHRQSPFDDESMLAAWDAYAAAHPTELILINSMRTCRPHRITGDSFEVSVENEIQIAHFRDSLTPLLTHLRNTLSNDNITLSFTVTDAGPAPTIWNEREIFTHIATEPAVARMIAELDLHLI